MRLYFAGAESKPFLDTALNSGANGVLMSYWAFKKNFDKFLGLVAPYQADVFMDCGAYSAWSQGFTINVRDYADFLVKTKHRITVYPNLDVKGDVEATLRNQEILEKEYGLNPIPVWHANTYQWDLLAEYISKYDYIALGAIAGETYSKENLFKVLDKVFSMVDPKNITKFHGFGLTVKEVLERYPFYSVDSTSWISGVKYGTNHSNTMLEQMHIKERNHKKMLPYGVKYYTDLEKFITDLWEKRGVVWK